MIDGDIGDRRILERNNLQHVWRGKLENDIRLETECMLTKEEWGIKPDKINGITLILLIHERLEYEYYKENL